MEGLSKGVFFSTRKNSFGYFVLFALFVGLLTSGLASRFFFVSGVDTGSLVIQGYFFSFAFFQYSVYLLFFSLACFLLGKLGLVRVSKILLIAFSWLFLVWFLADTFVYQQFRLHINLAMLQMTFLGGGQIVSFTFKMILEIICLIIGCLAAIFLCSYLAKKISTKLTIKIPLVLFFVVLIGFISAQIIYGLSYAKQKVEFTQVSQLLPFTRPVRFNKLLMKYGFISEEEVYSLNLTNKKASMKYPLNELQCEGGSEFNIVFLLVDSLRFDMVKPEIMPNIYQFSQEATVFKNHYSGGINTRHGIFTLFTGIPGSYWDKSLQTKSGSALIRALQQRGYEIGIFSAAPITMPEFNQTVFATVENPRVSSPGKTPIERDTAAIHDFENWLGKLPKDKKFFSFVFLDNVHANEFPEDEDNTVFKPYWKSVNHLELNNSYDPLPFFNRYKNSVHFADKQLGKALKILSEKIDLNKTIIVISSDHGEEFNDNKQNFWGHNGNFTKYQAQIPLIIKWPGKTVPQVEYRTSMLDIVPTILPEVLGCKNPVSDYSVGLNLFNPEKKRQWVYSSNYSKDAFIEANRIVLINELGLLNYLENNNLPSKDKTVPPYIPQVLEETTRFLK